MLGIKEHRNRNQYPVTGGSITGSIYICKYIYGGGIALAVIIRWWGHACFEILYGGVSITIDPHDGASIGLKRPGARSDYVLMSHEHFDHNAYRVVLKEGGRYLSMAVGENTLGPFKVRGIQTFHDKERGRRRGRNVAYVIETPDGLRIFHAGDLGHVLEKDHLRETGEVHLALLPVGGTFTIDHEEALQVFSSLNAKVMVPMHYWVKGVNLPLNTIDKLVERAKKEYKIYWVDGSEIEVSGKPGSVSIASKHSCRDEASGKILERCGIEVEDRAIVILSIG
ncbi:MAG: Zn-dependent hydrolase [Desulfurococcaceae archaeon]|nr:MAG: Zn-dependent hydrolase [Desulfurococcaceae archaeon]